MSLNNPPYCLTDELKLVVDKLNTKLSLSVNYQYGYISELNQTLIQQGRDESKYLIKFPCIYIAQPFVINVPGSDETLGTYYGNVEKLRIFIMTSTNSERKAATRMSEVFKPILYPIKDELLNQIFRHNSFISDKIPAHKQIDWYWWGNEQQTYLSDKVDCIELSNIEFKIKNSCT